MSSATNSEFPIFEYKFQVLESHLDSFGHINNATYLTLFEQARWEMIEQRGFGLSKIHELQVGPTILEINIKFKREIVNREFITIKTQLQSIKGKICYLKQLMVNKDEKICCEFIMTCGLFDMKKRRLISPTDHWLKAIGALAT